MHQGWHLGPPTLSSLSAISSSTNYILSRPTASNIAASQYHQHWSPQSSKIFIQLPTYNVHLLICLTHILNLTLPTQSMILTTPPIHPVPSVMFILPNKQHYHPHNHKQESSRVFLLSLFPCVPWPIQSYQRCLQNTS